MAKYSIGLDFGTLSVRALLIDIVSGQEIGISVFEYPHGVMDTMLPTGEKLPVNWALQDPQDYIDGMLYTVKNVVRQNNVNPKDIVGIGLDFTSSTILPVNSDAVPLCKTETFKREPHAYVKLWKHHGGEEEAEYINNIAKDREEKWFSLYGNKISSEWMLPKVLETLRYAPDVYEKSDRFIEALDWIVWRLTGKETRSICGLGYKAIYHNDLGFPTKEFYREIDSRMENFVEEKINSPIKAIGETAGYLTEEMAEILGLCPETPIGTPIIDAHSSMLGAGITKPGEMMIIMGTSAVHLLLSEKEIGIPGIGVIAKDGIVPGYYGYEAGQCCVGDIFAWFTKNCVPERYEAEAREKNISIHNLLVEKLNDYKAGKSGLLALDWFNGVRSPLMDFNLNGMIMGMNLLTKPEEIYLALIEATAYGTRRIVEKFEQSGVAIESVVLSGGIPMKNPMLVQVYADVLNRKIKVSETTQACAFGAAILGVAASSKEITGYKSLAEIAEKIGKSKGTMFYPDKENVGIYERLYAEYKTLSEYFADGANDVMKHLNKIRGERQ